MDKAKIKVFAENFVGATTVALICHINPDSDTLGSALALRLALSKMGIRTDVFCDDNPPERLSFLPTIDVVNSVSDVKKYDIAVAVDCGDPDRFNVCGKYFKHAKKTLVIDHHKTNKNFADFSVCFFEAGATAEIMYYAIRSLSEIAKKDLIDKDVATLLFAALVGDTGAFSFDNTTDGTFLMTSELMKYGVDSHDVIYRMIKSQKVKRFKLKARAMMNTRFFDDDKIAILTFFKKDFDETETGPDYTEGIINEVIDVDKVLIAYAVSEVFDKQYKISIRTKAPYDASSIAVMYGGGGHARASGCRISGFYEDVVDKLLKSARDEIL